MNNKARIRKIWISLFILILFIFVIYFIEYYLPPSSADYYINGNNYKNMIELLSNKENENIFSIWANWITFSNWNICLFKKNCDEKYSSVFNEIHKLSNTYFTKCSNNFIKIHKWWLINNYLNYAYVYSNKWFDINPVNLIQKINNNIIVYFNYDDTYTQSWNCKVE